VLAPGILSACVGVVGGQEVLEVVGLNGTLSEFTSSGSFTLASGVRTASVAFGSVGQVLDVVFANNQMFQFDLTGAHQLALDSRSGTPVTAGVALVRSGSATLPPNSPALEVLDVIFSDTSLWQFDSTGGHVLGKV
jgi:hypothetical protein